MIKPPQNSKRLFESTRFAVDERTFQTPSGINATKPMVTHGGSVIIVPILKDGRIVMIKNYRFSIDQQLWELPAGTLDPNEIPLECAKREVVEETGYQASKVTPLHQFFPAPGMTNEEMHAFLATGLTEVGQSLDDTEDIEVHPLSCDEIIQKIESHEIIDGKTIAMLLYYIMFHADEVD